MKITTLHLVNTYQINNSSVLNKFTSKQTNLNHQILCLCLILHYCYDRCLAKLYTVHHYDTQDNSIIDIRSISCFSAYKCFLSVAIGLDNII